MANKKKILIVEDDSFSLKIYTSYLTKDGYEVFASSNSEEALRLATANQPDLIMVDIMLSGGDGFSIIKNLRANPTFKKTPIITLSNLGQDVDVKKAMDLGANKYFVKSNVRFEEISETIKELLK